MKKLLIISLLIPLFTLSAQDRATTAANTTAGDLERALTELTQLRNDIAAGKIPLAKEINNLEDQKIELTIERDKVVEEASGANRVKAEMGTRSEELVTQIDYLHTALGNYIKEFIGVNIHVGEVQLYKEVADSAIEIQDVREVPLLDRFQAQIDAVNTSFDRLFKSVGGYKFQGKCELADGTIIDGNYAIIGPIGLFSDSASSSGLVSINPLSAGNDIAGAKLEKILTKPFAPEKEMADVTTTGQGTLFLDVKLGQALDIRNLTESLPEHIKKGGLVMWPILIIAAAAFLISIFKVFEIVSVKKGKIKDLEVILEHLNSDRPDDALAYARGIKGPVGDMLVAALEHIDSDEDLIEEILYERMLSTQPKLERFLPFIAVTAATAPLLGLLGTVTGMINTFKLITIFGTGDATQLSSGISEALITTEFGLVIAIPTLIAHALLSRMSKGVLGSMERTAVGLVNGLPHKN
ncbi:MotA/TolQ/ExbB proton channel family protein [Opitutia bacterium ISCC 51]|nr:MotA/TolQ/ExbB proton channel family protein [Opitutae bacterium ISCC 51]QXD27854.1 MotA/TolQ/ExbB proton channel family protein [Opitutae bacterium ISCC 52]